MKLFFHVRFCFFNEGFKSFKPVSLPSHSLPSGPGRSSFKSGGVGRFFAHAGNYPCNLCRSALNHANHQDAQSLSPRVDFSEPWKEGRKEVKKRLNVKNSTAEKISRRVAAVVVVVE